MPILYTNVPEIENELNDEVRLFFPYDDNPENIGHFCKIEGDVVRNSVKIGEKTYEFSPSCVNTANALENKRVFKRACKKAVYDALADFTGNKSADGEVLPESVRPNSFTICLPPEWIRTTARKCSKKRSA